MGSKAKRLPPSRPVEGRAISGVCVRLAKATGLGLLAWRFLFVLAAVFGVVLATSFALFDHRLFGGEPAHAFVRLPLIVLGLVLAVAYLPFALVMRFRAEPGHGPRPWDFGSSLAVLLPLVVAGQGLGELMAPFWDSAFQAWRERGLSGWFTWPMDHLEDPGLDWEDGLFFLALLCAAVFVFLEGDAVRRFFRAMHTGVTLVVLTTVAVTLGVMVPQIDGFEDPDQRVDLVAERESFHVFREQGFTKLPGSMRRDFEQYEAFRWAEGFFLYHLLHPYGIGMPKGELMPRMEEGLERFGRRYGFEESKNRRKQMLASMSGQEKSQEIGAFISRHENEFWRAFEVSTVLQLNRAYKSSWFAFLLFLLGVSIFLNTYKGNWRQWFTVQKFGFFVVHHGLLILLVGGLTSKLFTDRGILNLFLGEGPNDTYLRFHNPAKKAKMPFAVRLDRFARQDWKALEVHFLEDEFTSRVPRYTLWKDRAIELDYVENDDGTWRPRLRLEVKDLHERTLIGEPLVSEADPDERGGYFPVAELLIDDAHVGHDHGPEETHGDDEPRRAYLTPKLPPSFCYVDPAMGFRLAAAYGPNAEERVFPSQEGVLGSVQIRIDAQGIERVVPVRLGDGVTVGDYRISFEDATADFDPRWKVKTRSSHELPLEEQEPRFGAIWVDIQPPGGGAAERRVVFDGIDAVQQDMQREYANRDVAIQLEWDRWRAPGPPRYLLHWGDGMEPRLIRQGANGEGVTTVAFGEELPLPGDTPVQVSHTFDRAKFEKNLQFLEPTVRPDGWDEDFYSPMPKGLELEVVHDPDTDREVRETVRMATTEDGQSNVWYSGDERFALLYLENSEMLPFEWRSVISIIERDNAGKPYEVPLGSEEDREIRVNDYFPYRGYKFFQTNADARFPSYSGIGVVYDPGIWIVLAGMYTIIAGTAFAFLVRPIVFAVRKEGA